MLSTEAFSKSKWSKNALAYSVPDPQAGLKGRGKSKGGEGKREREGERGGCSPQPQIRRYSTS